jgi:hypothetical protein
MSALGDRDVFVVKNSRTKLAAPQFLNGLGCPDERLRPDDVDEACP